MPPSHHLSLLLQHFGCLSTVPQGHKLTVSDFPQVNVPVGTEGYSNLLSCGPHQEEQGAHGRCTTSLWGSPSLGLWRCSSPLPFDTKGFPHPLLQSVRLLSLDGWLRSPSEWQSCDHGRSNELLPTSSNHPRLPRAPERHLPCPCWGCDMVAGWVV